MGFQVNSDQVTGLFNNDPGGRVGYRENPVTGFDPIVTDIFLEPVRYFLGQGEPREPGRPENRDVRSIYIFTIILRSGRTGTSCILPVKLLFFILITNSCNYCDQVDTLLLYVFS